MVERPMVERAPAVRTASCWSAPPFSSVVVGPVQSSGAAEHVSESIVVLWVEEGGWKRHAGVRRRSCDLLSFR
jgi:hypothetical protein